MSIDAATRPYLRSQVTETSSQTRYEAYPLEWPLGKSNRQSAERPGHTNSPGFSSSKPGDQDVAAPQICFRQRRKLLSVRA